jgi:hypothetical protein
VATRARKKPSRASLKAKLDAMCRTVIMVRDRERCVHCNSTAWVQWSHVYTRRILCLRWNTLNSKALCASCHRWWHDNPAEAALWWNDWSRSALHPDAPEILQGIRRSMPDVDFDLVAEQLAQQLTKLRAER